MRERTESTLLQPSCVFIVGFLSFYLFSVYFFHGILLLHFSTLFPIINRGKEEKNTPYPPQSKSNVFYLFSSLLLYHFVPRKIPGTAAISTTILNFAFALAYRPFIGRSILEYKKKKKQKIAIGKCVYKWFILSPHSTLRGSPIFCCFETLERRKKEKTKKKNNSISEFTKDEALRILALYLLLLTYSPVVSSTFVLIYFFVGRVFSPLVCYPCHLVYELMAASLVTPMAHSTP